MKEKFNYYKFDQAGDLLYVNDFAGYFIKVSPPYKERADLLFATSDELIEYLEGRIKYAPKTFYPKREGEGISINLHGPDRDSD